MADSGSSIAMSDLRQAIRDGIPSASISDIVIGRELGAAFSMSRQFLSQGKPRYGGIAWKTSGTHDKLQHSSASALVCFILSNHKNLH